MSDRPPGLPPTPRCQECGGPWGGKSWMPRHLAECSIGQEQQRRGRVHQDVRSAIEKALAERRMDTKFMDRLHARIQADGVLLERLVEGEDV